ncbi:hypothetical protein ACFL5W_02450 [Thermodesulfobacteriota bacterium]
MLPKAASLTVLRQCHLPIRASFAVFDSVISNPTTSSNSSNRYPVKFTEGDEQSGFHWGKELKQLNQPK